MAVEPPSAALLQSATAGSTPSAADGGVSPSGPLHGPSSRRGSSSGSQTGGGKDGAKEGKGGPEEEDEDEDDEEGQRRRRDEESKEEALFYDEASRLRQGLCTSCAPDGDGRTDAGPACLGLQARPPCLSLCLL